MAGLPTEGGHVTKTYDRRQFLTHSAAAAGGVVAAGALAGELVFEGEAGAVTKGGTLTMGVISEQNKPFNPAHANMDTSGFIYARAVYDPLMVTSANGKSVYPYLAQSLVPNKSYTQWTVTARAGIKFHDGTVCNGDAIYANMLENYASALTGPAVKALVASFSHTPGTATVTVHTKHPWVTFPYTLAEQQICFIASPGGGSVPNTLDATYTGLPIGTGPFVAQSWVYNTAFTATANPDYWRAGLPYLGSVVFKPEPDGPTRFVGLTDGSYDIIHEAEGDILKKFPSLGPGYTYVTDFPKTPVYSPSSNCYMMNTEKAPLSNINLRRACAYALNQTQFVNLIDDGESKPIDGIFEPGSPYYKKTPYPSYNVAMAKKYIAKVPKSQRSFTVTSVQGDPAVQDSVALFQGFLGKIGVTVANNQVTQGALIGAAIYGEYQCMTWAQFGGVSPDLNHPWFSVKPPGYPTATWLNFARNQDPKIESLMIAAMASKSFTGQKNGWAAVNIRLNQDLPYLWIDRVVLGVAAHSNVQNWETFQDPAGHAVLQPNQAVLFFTSTWKS
jgi:peptide/nickel transport system substrate-binding protein